MANFAGHNSLCQNFWRQAHKLATMVKAIFFDIDGTLVSFATHAIPQSTLDAVREVRRKGVKVFIATGRPLPFIDNLGPLEYDGIMSVNGALCQTLDGVTIHKSPVDKADLERLIALHSADPFPIACATSDSVFVTEESDKVKAVFGLLDVKATAVRPLEACLDEEVMQIIAFFPVERQAQIMDEVLTGCEAHRWHEDFTDIIAKGNSKSTGIDCILAHYGFSLSEAMAFGDGGNDIPMLSHVPYGIAMGNASDAVKASASFVTDSVDDDGVAKVLSRIEEF